MGEAVRELYPEPEWAVVKAEPTLADRLADRCMRNTSFVEPEPEAKVLRFPVQEPVALSREERFEQIRTWHGIKPDGKFRVYEPE